jgi:hypothetical protein
VPDHALTPGAELSRALASGVDVEVAAGDEAHAAARTPAAAVVKRSRRWLILGGVKIM